MPTTCTKSTALPAATTCSSTSGRSRRDTRGRIGRPMTGIAFDPHWWRHSAATRWLRDGVPIEVVSTLLGHSSVAVTSSVYGHLTAEDARAALEKAGWFTGKEVS